MDAVISGRAGKALILDGDALMSFDLNGNQVLMPCHRADLRVLLGGSNDAIILEDTTRDEVLRRLELENNSAIALDLTLISLDPEHSDEVRVEAVEALDELLGDGNVVASVESFLYAKPLPDGADLNGALACCESAGRENAHLFFERLEENQPAIRNARYAWEAMPPSVFGAAQLKSQFHDVLVRQGLLRQVSTNNVDGNFGSLLSNALRNKHVSALRYHRDVLQQWTTLLAEGGIARPKPEVTFYRWYWQTDPSGFMRDLLIAMLLIINPLTWVRALRYYIMQRFRISHHGN